MDSMGAWKRNSSAFPEPDFTAAAYNSVRNVALPDSRSPTIRTCTMDDGPSMQTPGKNLPEREADMIMNETPLRDAHLT